MDSRETCVGALTAFGFTALEAEIYVYLLQHSPATGYKVAKGIGRSFTNTYKALDALKQKGAIIADEGATRLARAVPVEELVDRLRREFREQRDRLFAGVSQLPRAPADTRIYQLATVEQVYARAAKMLDEVQSRVLLELYPRPLARLQERIETVADRGPACAARVYEPARLSGVEVIISPFGAENLARHRFQWLSVLVDGEQSLLAVLTEDGEGVLEAIWTANPMLSRALYDYANSDLHHYSFRAALDRARSVAELRREYARLSEVFPAGGDPGFRKLVSWGEAQDTKDPG